MRSSRSDPTPGASASSTTGNGRSPGTSRRSVTRLAPVASSSSRSTSPSPDTRPIIGLGPRYARAVALDGLRKVVTIVEDVEREGGEPVEPPTRMVAAGAVVENPFAGRYVADLEPLIDRYCEPLGELLTAAGARAARRARPRASARARSSVSTATSSTARR